MPNKYVVRLTQLQREHLERLVRKGRAHARKLTCARILLKADANADAWTVTRGLRMLWRFPLLRWPASEGALPGGTRSGAYAKEAGQTEEAVSEAHLIAPSCSDPPEGKERWSMRILADRMVEVGYVESVSYETVKRTLKKLHQATPQAPVGNSSQEKCCVCVENRGDSGSLRGALRPEEAGGLLLRREILPAHGRCERAFADGARPHRALRLGVRARRRLLGAHNLYPTTKE